MRTPRRIFFKATASQNVGVVGPTGVSVGGSLLKLTTASGNSADVGSNLTAKLADGVTGTFQFTQNSYPITGAVGTGNSATYTVQSIDADQLLDVKVTDLSFVAGLTASADTTTLLSFSGSSAAGSVVTAQLSSGFTGSLTIRRADGTVAATASSAASVNYTMTSADQSHLPFSATASTLILSAAIPTSAGSSISNPFITVNSSLFGSTVAAGDSFDVLLAPGVSGLIDFTSNGTVVTSTTVVDNALSYAAQSSDAGHSIGAVVSHLAFETGGVFGTPVIQSATGAAVLYSLEILDSARGVLRMGYMPLANLDATSVPLASNFTLGGTIRTAKTITSVAIDNSATDRKYVLLTMSNPFQPSDAPTLAYSGTAIRYTGGASAVTFSARTVLNSIPPLATLCYIEGGSNASQYDHTSPAGTIAMLTASNFFAQLVYTPTDTSTYYSPDDVTVQMSILPDWGTDTTIIRMVSFTESPGSYGYFNRAQENLYRTGNTVVLREKPQPEVGSSDAVAVGASYTFASPGANCLARLQRTRADYLTRLQVSTDSGDTWTTVATGAIANLNPFACLAWSSSTTVPVTGVGTTGLPV